MILVGNLTIRCSACGMEYTIVTDSLDEDVSYIGEGGMGEQYQHTFAGEIECERCRQHMIFRLLGFEYPVGAKEYQTSESDGCEIIEEPYMEMDYIPEPLLSVYDQILLNSQAVYDLKTWEFEELVAEIYRRNGFNAKVTQRTRDGGRDVIATCGVGGITYREPLKTPL